MVKYAPFDALTVCPFALIRDWGHFSAESRPAVRPAGPAGHACVAGPGSGDRPVGPVRKDGRGWAGVCKVLVPSFHVGLI